MIRTYTALKQFETFAQRYEYLKLNGEVGADTFGFDRYLNQVLYHSDEWKSVRRQVVLRDNGCDLGVDGYDISDRIIIHHMNPLSLQQVEDRDPVIFDPEYLICCCHSTHNAIHYGTENPESLVVQRKPGDTCPWK